jgi:hypothetical protein
MIALTVDAMLLRPHRNTLEPDILLRSIGSSRYEELVKL